MASTTWRVKAPWTVEVPSRIVGPTPLMVSTNPTGPEPDAQGASERFLAYVVWKSRRSSMSSKSRPCLSTSQTWLRA